MREMAGRGGRRKSHENSDGARRADLIDAIAHRLRRRILRLLGDRREQSSPTRLAKELDLQPGLVAYHVRVLQKLGAVRPTDERMVRGAIEHFYETTIEDDPPIETLLEETREADDEHA
jgi:DNA-binding transcriptional ArsR family regulator